MGTSAVIFFDDKNERPSINQLLKDCKEICLDNNLDFLTNPYGKVTEFQITDRPLDEDDTRYLIVYADDKTDDDYREFEWYNDCAKLYICLWVEKIGFREDMLFLFAYPFFQRYPSAKLWIDWTDWLFTLTDLEKIAPRFDDCKDSWCCKNPDGSEYYATLSYCIDGHNIIEKTICPYTCWLVGFAQHEAEKVITAPFAVDITVEGKGVMSVAQTKDYGILSCYLAEKDAYFISLGNEHATGEANYHFGDYCIMSNKYLIPKAKIEPAIKEWIKHGVLSKDIQWNPPFKKYKEGDE